MRRVSHRGLDVTESKAGDGDGNGNGDEADEIGMGERVVTNEYPRLHHENLDAYRAAIEFLALAARLVDGYPRGFSSMADQLRRASLSVPLNIAEGYGKRAGADRARFFDIARGSAHECGALLDASKVLGMIDEPTFRTGKTLLHRIVSMLVKMTR